MTDLPLEKHLTKLEKSGRIRTWGVELGEFALEYVPRAAMKSQVLADFVVECTIPSPTEELPPPPMELRPWVAFVDGSACEAGSGAEVVLESPKGLLTEHALRFTFRASNNAAEYEAALAAMWLAKAAGAKRLQIKSDSQLVVGQATGEFEAKDKVMKRYQERIVAEMAYFDEIKFLHIPREENSKADALARLASSPTAELGPTTLLEILFVPSVNMSQVMEVTQEEPCWMDPLKYFILHGKLPEDPIEAQRIVRRSANFIMHDGKLL